MFGIVPLAKVRGLWGWVGSPGPWGRRSLECPGLPHGSSRSPAQAGRLYSSLAALMLQQHGRYQRGSPSEICCQCAHLSPQPEEKQKAAQQFTKLQTAMKVLGISPDEQKACWLILAAIYHLGAAGATRGNRAVDPSSLAGHLESWRGPSPLAVGPGPAQTHLLSDTPLWLVPLPRPLHQSRSLQTPGEASLPRTARGLD